MKPLPLLFMKNTAFRLLLLFIGACSLAAQSSERPNIVMFVLDDLCDWVSPMGYDQAITPQFDRLASQGITFTNAHTAGTYCAPSRSAFFTGRHASTTGCYTNQVYYQHHPQIKPLQVSLHEAGYKTYGAGKLFHHGRGFLDQRGWDEFFVRTEGQKKEGWPLDSWDRGAPWPDPYPASIYNHDREPTNRFFLEWGAIPDSKEEELADTIRTNWAVDVLKRDHNEPFFLAVGLYTPHFPNYAPQKYFDLYDVDKIKAPPYKKDDLDDLPDAKRREKINRSRIHQRLESLDAVEEAIYGYLACVSYADAMLGRVLDALDNSPYKDNTIVILWSDHGYHHGEKGDWGKHNLWERTTNVPLIISGKPVASGRHVNATVSLIDIYPTLVDLCGLEPDEGLEGVSLASILKDPSSAVDRNVYVPYLDPGG